eukprot:CAMPEP_0185726370 /NCGR_PEP_ID=MMETSP1171-20130828/2376_1 /TAXON_ID=374046 /ORGANISM="Helicotheca tamensis, Strain CCMP826" /LENGTH=35 /DNA_ID= /DNA_START= /DNA_END= /DNA_ORIENTATION=
MPVIGSMMEAMWCLLLPLPLFPSSSLSKTMTEAPP